MRRPHFSNASTFNVPNVPNMKQWGETMVVKWWLEWEKRSSATCKKAMTKWTNTWPGGILTRAHRTPDYPYRGQITIRTPRGPEGPRGQLIIRTNPLQKSRRPVESSGHRPTWLKELRSTSGHWPVRVMEARLSYGHHGVLVEWLAMLQSSGYVMICSGVRFSLGSVLFHKIWSRSRQYCRR